MRVIPFLMCDIDFPQSGRIVGKSEHRRGVGSILSMTSGQVFGAIAQLLLIACFHVTEASGQVTVMEVKVIDKQGKGVISNIIEITRERHRVLIDKTDDNGIFNKKFPCKEWHKLLAEPVAGPYSESSSENCRATMVLSVSNIDNYPEKAVRIVVPFPAGSSTDVLARVIGQRLTETWEQQVLIDNKAGAGGNIGAIATAEATPDGYTLLLGTSPIFTTNPILYTKLPYDPIKGLAAVTMVATMPNVLVVARSLPVQSVKGLIQLTKSKPGQISFASAGNGTTSHLAGELFKDMTGTNIVHIPYKGNSPALMDLSSGRVELSFTSLQPLLPYIKSGELKALGVTGIKRSAVLPDVPTIAEAGVPGYEANSWAGVFAPARTHKEVIHKLNTEIIKILSIPDVREKLASQGAEPVGNTPEQFAATVNADIAKWAKVVKASGLRAD